MRRRVVPSSSSIPPTEKEPPLLSIYANRAISTKLDSTHETYQRYNNQNEVNNYYNQHIAQHEKLNNRPTTSNADLPPVHDLPKSTSFSSVSNIG